MRHKDMNEVLDSAVVTDGLRLTETRAFRRYSKRAFDIYEKLHKHQPDPMTRAAFGHVMRNFLEWQTGPGKKILAEATTQSSMPYLRDYGFELITALLPGLIANELYTTQPARFKNFSIFYQDFQYQSGKGPITATDKSIKALLADNIDQNYTRDAEVDKTIGTGDGAHATYTVGTGVLYVPIVPSTVSITATRTTNVTMVAVDNGANIFTGDVGAPGSVSYTTGAITVVFAGNVKASSAVLLTYEYIGEASQTNAMEYGLTITEIQGQAKERRLRYNFSIESQFSYRQQFGRSMDADLLAGAIAQIRKEIDQQLNLTAYALSASGSAAGSISWNRTPDAGVQYFYWREQFIDALHSAGNLIIKATGHGGGNFACGGLNFKQVCETIGPRFKAANTVGIKGARFLGDLDNGAIKCYYEPALSDNQFFVGYKGGPLEVGLSFNPWMPLYVSEPHMLDNGKLHRYLITSNGITTVNAKFYVKGTLLQT